MESSEKLGGSIAKEQVTSNQILLGVVAENENTWRKPQLTIQDLDELRSHQLTKRANYEKHLNKNRLNFGEWLRYARWELEYNHDFARARSIYERALDVNIQHIPFWVQYVRFELANKNVNHARNILDRAVTTLPRVDKLWFLYAQTEEALKNYSAVRLVFNRWLEWKPNEAAWDAYINFEKRYEEYDNVRVIFTRYLKAFANGKTWLKWIDFEINDAPANNEQVLYIRSVFELAADSLLKKKSVDENLPVIIKQWADWEISVKEYERARSIYKILLDEDRAIVRLSDIQKRQIYQSFTEFEKAYGDKDTVESGILLKRKLKYEDEIKENPQDYDTWWVYLDILINEQDTEKIRSVFSRAISSTPTEKKVKTLLWRRYILLCIRYALWEEFEGRSTENARAVWKKCLESIPHKHFTFGKVWIYSAEFEIRNDDTLGLMNARKLLGRSLGQTSHNKPKRNVLKFYISLEKKLGEYDRVRKLFEKWIELSLSSTSDTNTIDVMIEYIEFERSLQEFERCISIYNLGLLLAENELVAKKFTTPERLWMSFITFLKDEMKYDDARKIYRRLLEKVSSPKVWISFALFESSIPTEEQLKQYEETNDEEIELLVTDLHKENTRKLFTEAETYFKNNDNNQDRIVILEAWKTYEQSYGTPESIEKVENKLPIMVKRTKKVDGVEEEYLDYIFPEDSSNQSESDTQRPAPATINKFLANAKKWALKN